MQLHDAEAYMIWHRL